MIHTQSRTGGVEYWIIDLGSANGSFLNGRRLLRPSPLHDEDRIMIAEQEFTFRIDSTLAGNPEKTTASSLATLLDTRSGPGWLLVADIADSTPLIQRLPTDQLATKLGCWLRRCTEAIEAHAGTINQYLGDGFLAYWAGGMAAVEGVAATVRKLQGEQQHSELPFRIVLHFGEFTITKEPAQGVETLLAPAVHYLFRAEKVAGTTNTSVLFTAAAREAIGALMSLIRLPGDFELKGFQGRHVFYTPEARISGIAAN
jgi:adenylate cyclase